MVDVVMEFGYPKHSASPGQQSNKQLQKIEGMWMQRFVSKPWSGSMLPHNGGLMSLWMSEERSLFLRTTFNWIWLLEQLQVWNSVLYCSRVSIRIGYAMLGLKNHVFPHRMWRSHLLLAWLRRWNSILGVWGQLPEDLRNFTLLPSTSLCRLRRSHGIDSLERRLAAESTKFNLAV